MTNLFAYRIPDWESVEYHKKLQGTDFYPSLLEKAKSIGDLTSVAHVALKPFPATQGLDAPVTEVLTRTLKDESYKAELFATLETARGVAGDVKGFLGASIGPTVENEKQFIALIGWDSVEVSSYIFIILLDAYFYVFRIIWPCAKSLNLHLLLKSLTEFVIQM